MGLISQGKSAPLETLCVIREIIAETARRVNATDVQYCTQGSASAQNLGGAPGNSDSVVYKMDIGERRGHWSSLNGSILVEIDLRNNTVCCGRAPEKHHELHSSYPIEASIGDPDLIDQLVKYIEITTETINPKVEPPTFKQMIMNALHRWIRGN